MLGPKKPRDLALTLEIGKDSSSLHFRQVRQYIVPFFSFHVNGSYKLYWQPRRRSLEGWSRWADYTPLLFYGRWNIPLLIPRANKLTVVIVRPIHIPKEGSFTRDLVDKYHGIFLKEMKALFERHKKIGGYGDVHIKIVQLYTVERY